MLALHTEFPRQRRCDIDEDVPNREHRQHRQREAFQYRTAEEVQHQNYH